MSKKIHIGCGFSVGESWENFDSSPTLRFERLPLIGRVYTKNGQRFPIQAKYGDITKKVLCKPGFADVVFCSHVLEHLTRYDMELALSHIYSMLKSGGVFRLIVPDLEAYAYAYLQSSSQTKADDFLEHTCLGLAHKPRKLIPRVISLFGAAQHLWMYDEVSMRERLAQAGFKNVRRCEHGDSVLADFSEVEDSSRFFNVYGLPELAVECEKP